MSPFVLVGTHSSGRVSSLMFPISPPVIRSSHRGGARGAHVSSAGAAPGPPPLPPRLLGVNPGECSPPPTPPPSPQSVELIQSPSPPPPPPFLPPPSPPPPPERAGMW